MRLRDALVEEEEAVGWWQKPEERSLQAYAPRQLNDRQIRRLEELYAVNGRKMKVGTQPITENPQPRPQPSTATGFDAPALLPALLCAAFDLRRFKRWQQSWTWTE